MNTATSSNISPIPAPDTKNLYRIMGVDETLKNQMAAWFDNISIEYSIGSDHQGYYLEFDSEETWKQAMGQAIILMAVNNIE
jgi:hypothetical protein